VKGLPVAAIAAALFSCHGRPPPAPPTLSRCAAIRGAANAAFERVPNVSDWYDVYRVTDGVYALSEPRQWREVISYWWWDQRAHSSSTPAWAWSQIGPS
jgi:hypothetical protein